MNVDEARRVLGALENGDEWRDVHDTAVAVLGLRADNYRARPDGMEGAEHWSKAWRGRVTEAADLRRAITLTHPIVPVAKLPSAWREAAEAQEQHAETIEPGVDRAEWEAMAGQLREDADELERALTEEALGDDGRAEDDRKLGAAFRELYDAWMADADEDGIISGSASDQCSDVYQVFTSHGLVVR